MSVNTQNPGQKLQHRIKQQLFERQTKGYNLKMGQLKQNLNSRYQKKVKDPSPTMGVVLPLAVQTSFCEDGLRSETCLESNVM